MSERDIRRDRATAIEKAALETYRRAVNPKPDAEITWAKMLSEEVKGIWRRDAQAALEAVGYFDLVSRCEHLERGRDGLRAEVEQIKPELERVINLGDRLEVAEQTITHLKAVIEDACHVRPVVLWFACEMEKQLRKHDEVTGCQGWRGLTFLELFELLDREREELSGAFGNGTHSEMIHETVDLANIAMMIADNANVVYLKEAGKDA